MGRSLFRSLYVMLLLSQKVVWCSSCNMGFSTSRGRVEYQKVFAHLFIYLHYSCFVSTSITVIWRRKNCHDFLFMAPIISLNSLYELLRSTYRHNKLMRTSYCLKSVLLNKLCTYIHSECVSCSSG